MRKCRKCGKPSKIVGRGMCYKCYWEYYKAKHPGRMARNKRRWKRRHPARYREQLRKYFAKSDRYTDPEKRKQWAEYMKDYRKKKKKPRKKNLKYYYLDEDRLTTEFMQDIIGGNYGNGTESTESD